MNRSLAIRIMLATAFFVSTSWVESYVSDLLRQINPFHWALLPVWLTWWLTSMAVVMLCVFWKPIE